jgi:iron complex transport system substrate-binding protein
MTPNDPVWKRQYRLETAPRFAPVPWCIRLILSGCLVVAGCKPAPPPVVSQSTRPRVVSLAPNITEIVCALGAASQLAGRSSACDYPPDLVGKVPIAGDFGVPSLERLLAVKPDGVLYTDLADMTLDSKLRRIGLHPAKIACSRLEDIPGAITTVGALLHRETEAATLALELKRRIDAARAAIPTGPRPRVLILIWNDPLTAVGRNAFIADLVTLAGGQNLGDEINRDYFQVSREWVLARDPDVILCFFMASEKPVRQVVMQMPGWNNLKAVREQRVYDGFDNNVVVRPGPRVIEGLNQIRPYIRMDTPDNLRQTSSPVP